MADYFTQLSQHRGNEVMPRVSSVLCCPLLFFLHSLKTWHHCSLAELQEGIKGDDQRTMPIQAGQIYGETYLIGWFNIPSLHHYSERVKISDIQPSTAAPPYQTHPPINPSIINQPLLHLSHLSKGPGFCLPQVHPPASNYCGSLGFIHFTLLSLSLFIYEQNSTVPQNERPDKRNNINLLWVNKSGLHKPNSPLLNSVCLEVLLLDGIPIFIRPMRCQRTENWAFRDIWKLFVWSETHTPIPKSMTFTALYVIIEDGIIKSVIIFSLINDQLK